MSASGIVLFVDDDRNLLAGLKRVLRSEIFELLLAEGPTEAFEVLERCTVDVVISDQNMPGLKGTDFLAEVRRRWPGTVRIMLTGDTDQEVAKRAINDGEIYRFFTKPRSSEELAFDIWGALDVARLKRESATMLHCLREQRHQLEWIEQEHPGITHVDQDEKGRIVIKPEDVPDDLEAFIAELRAELERFGR